MGTMRTHRRKTAGFTLIEMMVVIIIMAVVVAFAVPAYKSLVTQYRMSDELNEIASDVALARSMAIKEGLDVTICPSSNPTASVTATTPPSCSAGTEWNTGWIIFTDTALPSGNQTFTTDTGDVLLHVHNGLFGSDTLVSTLTGGTGNLSAITFNRMGGATNFGSNSTQSITGNLTLNDSNSDASMIRCLIISEAGTIQVHSPQTQTQASCP
jgi:type IV fimbrial biogenesis protein FimT